MTDGEKLKALRETMRLTQQELADKMGVNQQSLGHVETGKNKEMSFGSFKMLIANTGVNPYYFLSDNPGEPMFASGKLPALRKRIQDYDRLIDKMMALRISK